MIELTIPGRGTLRIQHLVTDVNGTLVYSTRAEGGQAVWDGKNFDGRKARTGVYLVYASNDSGSEKVVTKILIIH